MLSVFPPAAHAAPDAARMLWAQSVLLPPPLAAAPSGHSVPPFDDTPAAAAARVAPLCVHVQAALPRMHPKFAMLALKGLAGIADAGAGVSEERRGAAPPAPRVAEVYGKHSDRAVALATKCVHRIAHSLQSGDGSSPLHHTKE
jgi:hypothetical protein